MKKIKHRLFDCLPFLSTKQEEFLFQSGLAFSVDVYHILQILRDYLYTEYKVLVCLSGVDYLERKNRFEIVYHLCSQKKNHYLALKTYMNENTGLKSVVSLYPSASWWERELWDLFGVFIEDHPDLRRILTDYGFEGHPLRKDFPLSGYTDLRYDESQKRVVIEDVSFDQVFRNIK